jgi:hypothetical protein
MSEIRNGAKSDARGHTHWLALLVAVLLVGQSLLCVAHCAFSAPTDSTHGAVAYGFYCPIGAHHHHSPNTEHTPIPAFWPGVLFSLALIAGVLLVLARVAGAVAVSPPAPRWAPPVPPPR